jgi:uncharacterized membrane protein YeaQ/YmgE (transglycosylase-associated protein family)
VGSRIVEGSRGEEVIVNILWTIVVGFVIGLLAKLFMPGRDPGGFIITVLLGIAGSVIAGFVGRSMGWYAQGQGAGILASIVGAMVLLLIYRMFRGGRSLPA